VPQPPPRAIHIIIYSSHPKREKKKGLKKGEKAKERRRKSRGSGSGLIE